MPPTSVFRVLSATGARLFCVAAAPLMVDSIASVITTTVATDAVVCLVNLIHTHAAPARSHPAVSVAWPRTLAHLNKARG